MDALLTGTGGADGWPQPGCLCASCRRAIAAGLRRKPAGVLVDGIVEFRPGRPPRNVAGSSCVTAVHVEAVSGGWDVTGADGGRMLIAAGPGEVPQPQPGARPYDVALLDLLASPSQLGWLRKLGLVHSRTAVAALYTDHRVTSPAELARRCELWRAGRGQDGQRITGPVSPGQAESTADRGAGRTHRTLIIGGARSGKSTEAELRLAGEPEVRFVAAGPWR
ncbi:MAG: bifunctional adenosylcobinamide kinase/adenosylcobinamide-phosphate guanylyltransferase, partial [Actinobacteria bacterium]|nr:bifunctional adenosylcobinamide kinase/adenosylcobinamide-phosphate guanylyltransferase [Actinomycetota bacterium]